MPSKHLMGVRFSQWMPDARWTNSKSVVSYATNLSAILSRATKIDRKLPVMPNERTIQQLLTENKIIFSKHAIQRLKETDLDLRSAISSLRESYKYTAFTKQDKKYKLRKYGEKNGNVFYRQNGTVLFTCRISLYSKTKTQVITVMTVTDQRVNIKFELQDD